MRYILTTTAKRKGGKRHIVMRSSAYFDMLNTAKHIDKKRYVVEIYKGNWELVKEV